MDLIDYDILSIKKEHFRDCNIEDDFFSSLKTDYPGFRRWFSRKCDEPVYTHRDADGSIQGFLYLKEEKEDEDYHQMRHPLEPKRRLKIGTFKISENGYYMGERFFKVIFENAIKNDLYEVYVTIFPHHELLLDYFIRFGFSEVTTMLDTGEIVLLRNLKLFEENWYQGYPILQTNNQDFYILPIKPEYHTHLLPDAILRTEDNSKYINNNKAGNALKKVYFGRNLWKHRPNAGDIIFFYRTKDTNNASPAHYQSVITSMGVVSNYGHADLIDITELERLLNKCVLEEHEINEIKRYSYKYRFIEFIYYGKLDYRVINLAYMRDFGIEAPRGIEIVANEFAYNVLKKSGYSEGIII
ncbi:MAG: hypothetical protein PHR70_09780 [Tissierellia bacterium]|nr:hypothetical protein [Tissierellia bacterium]